MPASADIPTAVIRPRRRVSLAWLIPIAALLLVGFLFWRAWSMQGMRITVSFTDGHHLRAGDEVRYRGVTVGEVESITLDQDLQGATATISLLRESQHLARQGAQFWIVRPSIGPSGVSGLDTIVGPRYIAVRPGAVDAPFRDHFIGLEYAPIVEEIQEGDLEIIVQSVTRGSLQAGGPVNFRGVRVGTVLSVHLASDGSAVEARLHIEKPYVPLVTDRSRFWDSGGLQLDMQLTGITLDVDSLEAAILGGVTFATPESAGAPVATGHRFTLYSSPEETWLGWRASLPIGNELLPAGSRIPEMERAALSWETSLLKIDKTRRGWVLSTERGLLGPADLLKIEEDAASGSSRLSVAGRNVPISTRAMWESQGLALINAPDIGSDRWPGDRMRSASEPEDCLLMTAGTTNSMPLAAARLSMRDGFWKVDDSMSLDDRWHGACVLSRIDGMLVGMLLVTDGVGRVALLPQSFLE